MPSILQDSEEKTRAEQAAWRSAGTHFGHLPLTATLLGLEVLPPGK